MVTIIDPEVRCHKCGFQDSTPIDPLFFIHKNCVKEIESAFSREKEVVKLAREQMLLLFGKEEQVIWRARLNDTFDQEQTAFLTDWLKRMRKEIGEFKV